MPSVVTNAARIFISHDAQFSKVNIIRSSTKSHRISGTTYNSSKIFEKHPDDRPQWSGDYDIHYSFQSIEMLNGNSCFSANTISNQHSLSSLVILKAFAGIFF